MQKVYFKIWGVWEIHEMFGGRTDWEQIEKNKTAIKQLNGERNSSA